MGLDTVNPTYSTDPATAYFNPAGGLHGTMADYYQFAQMLGNNGELNGTRLLSPQAVELMTMNHIGDKYTLGFEVRWGYAMAVAEDPYLPTAWIYMGRPGSYGWSGYFSTRQLNDPERDTVIIVATQCANDECQDAVTAIMTALGAAVVGE